MRWNSEQGYVNYKTALSNIQSIFNIPEPCYLLDCKLAPYVTLILSYVNKRLVLMNCSELETNIQEVINIFDQGSRLILNGATFDLLSQLDIHTGNDNCSCSCEDDIPFSQDLFIFAWTNVMTSLTCRLKIQYSSLLNSTIQQECPCAYPSGDTTETYEQWSSGVYPNDESYSYYGGVGSSDFSSISDNTSCTNCR